MEIIEYSKKCLTEVKHAGCENFKWECRGSRGAELCLECGASLLKAVTISQKFRDDVKLLLKVLAQVEMFSNLKSSKLKTQSISELGDWMNISPILLVYFLGDICECNGLAQ